MLSKLVALFNQMRKSKTIIVNVLVVAGGVIGYLTQHEVIMQHPDMVAALATALGVVNVVLRFMTTVPVWQK